DRRRAARRQSVGVRAGALGADRVRAAPPALVRLPPPHLLMSRTPTLRSSAPWRVLDGFGSATRAASRYAKPGSVDELAELLARARSEDLNVTFRGSGRSYGDASLNTGGLVIDIRGLDRMLRWDPEGGIAELEPGVTIEGLWRRTLEDGWWPAVVPGTYHPTMGGCVAM